jgi:hypothetical protein
VGVGGKVGVGEGMCGGRRRTERKVLKRNGMKEEEKENKKKKEKEKMERGRDEDYLVYLLCRQ